ncbi:MAG: hypothetical protein AAF438_20965, partial [Pseudomonadota bacterium]
NFRITSGGGFSSGINPSAENFATDSPATSQGFGRVHAVATNPVTSQKSEIVNEPATNAIAATPTKDEAVTLSDYEETIHALQEQNEILMRDHYSGMFACFSSSEDGNQTTRRNTEQKEAQPKGIREQKAKKSTQKKEKGARQTEKSAGQTNEHWLGRSWPRKAEGRRTPPTVHSIAEYVSCTKSIIAEKRRTYTASNQETHSSGITMSSFRLFVPAGRQGWLKFLLFLLFAALVKPAAAEKTLQIEPMVCQTLEGRSVWHLPSEPRCGTVQPIGASLQAQEITLMLYKRNMIQCKTKAWVCIIVYQKVKTFSYFFNDERLKEEETREETVTREDCTQMVKFHKCPHGAMTTVGDMYQTNNKVNRE